MNVGFRTRRNTRKHEDIRHGEVGWKSMKTRDSSWDLIMKDRMCL